MLHTSLRSSPFSGASGLQWDIFLRAAKLNFIKLLSDSITLKGVLPLAAANLPLTGHKIVADVGGFIAAYILDIKGKSPKSKTSSFSLSPKPSKTTGLSTFTMKILKSNLAGLDRHQRVQNAPDRRQPPCQSS